VGFNQKDLLPWKPAPTAWLSVHEATPSSPTADNVLEWLTKGAHGLFDWKGQATFGEGNVNSIALEVPNDMLGPGPRIGVWLTISLRKDGKLVPIGPGGQSVVQPDPQTRMRSRTISTTTDPIDDVKKFLKPLSEVLVSHGYNPGRGKSSVAVTVLPDILHYDRTKPARYPTGRTPTDDVFSIRFAVHDHRADQAPARQASEDMVSEFPFMGIPHPTKVAESV